MKLNPYLTFKGDCKEAMTFYANVLDATIDLMHPFSEMPPGEYKVPEEAKDLIMHASISFKGNHILASDSIEEVTNGNNFSMSINVENNEEGAELFDKLSEGGQTIMPFDDVFWGGKFGMLQDKFGIKWMISGPHK